MANKELTGRVAGCAALVGGESSGQGRSATPAAVGANRERESPSSAPPRRGRPACALALSPHRGSPRAAPPFFPPSRLDPRGSVAAASSRLTSTALLALLALTSCASLYYLFRLFLSTMLFYAHLLSRSLALSVAYMYNTDVRF